MRIKHLAIVCGLLLLAGTLHATAQQASQGYAEGKVRVKLQPEVASRLSDALLPTGKSKINSPYLRTGIASFDRVSQKVKAVRMTRVFPFAGKDEARHAAAGLDLWYDIEYSTEGMSAIEARNLYRTVPGISHAQRIFHYSIVGGNTFRPVSSDEMNRLAAKASGMPFNDPLLSGQWHYYNDGSLLGSMQGADINIFPAWAEGNTGSKDVVVAIIDGGFQIDHPDLKDNLWINAAELNGKPGVDDDGDGYVDDIYGYNFVINSANVTAHQHGTHVAGTVGATNNNGLGVAGVAGGRDGKGGVKMMVCQIFDSNASGNTEVNYAGALVYAADRGASIAQCSWGQGSPDDEDLSVTEAVRYFTKYGGGDKMNGGLCIFASGNTSNEGNYFPGCLPEVVAVAASTPMGTVATYSTHGTWVDVAAPGGLSEAGEKYEVLSTLPNSSYGYMEGTSMACPHVSGVAALILSKYGNKNFSNETLRTLLTSSVNRLYYESQEVAAEYEGKCGAGVIDAYKALQGSESSIPGAVQDFTVIPSHNYVTVQWTIPESEEKSVDHHVVYYSQQPITPETNLQQLSFSSFDTKYNLCGDKVQFEVEGLEAMTTYYFTIVAYNRWGRASEMSSVVKATTNEGPEAKLLTESISLTVNADKSPTATARVVLRNNGKGILKYAFRNRTLSASPSPSARGVVPMPGRMVQFAGGVAAVLSQEKTYPVVAADYEAQDYPDSLCYGKSIKAYIGEDDLELPNALAQYFYVDPAVYPNGFNLTDLSFLGSYGKNPVIEIYEGSRSISAASLLTEVNYDEWDYRKYLPLDEQLFFAPGSGFWVVAKFAAGQRTPLGGCATDVEGIQNYSFYSSDNGETWTQLSNVLQGGNLSDYADSMTWGVFAISRNPNWSSLLNPSPATGEIAEGKQATIKFTNDGQPLVNGTYKFRVHLQTNEAQQTDRVLGVTLNVNGYKPQTTSRQLVDFGSLLVGQERTYSVEIFNRGYGAFAPTGGGSFYTFNGSMACSSDQFQLDQSLQSIQARSSRTLGVTFKPTKAGNFSGTVTLTDKNGQKHEFTVCGTAIDPARLVTEQTQFDLGDLEAGAPAKEAVIRIKNEGKYPLQYVFPKFSDENIEGSGKAHRYGYTYQTNIDGINRLDYEPVPELDDEVDITDLFNDRNWQSEYVPLGFKFPFYGKDYQEVVINSRGAVQMQRCQTVTIGALVADPASVKSLGYISGYGNNGMGGCMYMIPGSKVSYGHKDGKFYVIYNKVQVQGVNQTLALLSMHMVLDAQGCVTIYYDDYDPSLMRDEGILNYIGVCDIEGTDPMTVTYDEMARAGDMFYSKVKTGSVIRLVAPGKSMITSLSAPDGYVGIGQTREITVQAQANDSLFAGELTNHIIMLTNDPAAPSKVFSLTANITGEGFHGDAVIDSTQVDFGRVFRTSQQRRTMRVLNNGTKEVVVASVTSQNASVLLQDEVTGGFTVKPNESKDVRITLPTQQSGKVSDVVVVSYADGTRQEVPVRAEVIGAPAVAVTPDHSNFTVAYGEPLTTDFTLSNPGDEPLELTVKAGDWYALGKPLDDEQTSIHYTYRSSEDFEEVKYDWVDITQDYDEHCNMVYFADQTDFKEIELPFQFPFYGKKTNRIWVYNTGFIQFSRPKEDYKMWPEPPASLPDGETFYRDILCPLWGMHSMSSNVEDGVFIKKYDDHVVITFKDYGNSVMDGFNFQCILRKDGTAKFQYQLDWNGVLNGIFGIAGAQDAEARRGFTIPNKYTYPDLAIEVSPEVSYRIAPGQQLTMPIDLKTNCIADTYAYALQFTTNDPQQPRVEVPVTLTTTGEALPVVPESLSINQVYDAEYQFPAEVEFTVSNAGHKAFTINDITAKLFQEDENYQYAAQLAIWKEGSNGDDPDPGPLSLQSEENFSWQPYWSGQSQPIVVGEEPVRMKVYFLDVAKPGSYEDVITFHLEGMDDLQIPFNVQITDAPRMVFSQDSIVLANVSKDYEGSHRVNISNKGRYQLSYTLTLDPMGRDVSLEDELGGGGGDIGILSLMRPAEAASFASLRLQPLEPFVGKSLRRMAKVRKEDAYIWDDPVPGDERTPDAPEHTNALYYPVMQPIQGARIAMLGSGETHSGEQFVAATRYIAPQEGFNLSHVFFVGTIGDLENVDVEANVILGQNVASTKNIIGHGKLRIAKEEEVDGGHYGTAYTVKLDNPLYINPNDTFYISLKFPAGYPANMFMVSKNGDKSEERYMAYFASNGGWVDVEELVDATYGYGAFGYFMTALEETPGKPWISLSADTQSENVIQPGETADFQVDIHAAGVYFDKGNRATLVVRSNDPDKRVYNYHIYLDRNSAPVIQAPKSTATVAQGAEVTVEVSIADQEGEAFQVSLEDANGSATVADFVNAQGTQEGIRCEEGVVNVEAGQSLRLSVRLAPDFNVRPGLAAFTLHALDAQGNAAFKDVPYNVEATNRAPQYVGAAKYTAVAGTASPVFQWTDLFTDPDDDAMTFEASIPESLGSIFRSETGFMILAKKTGLGNLTLSATDAQGETTTVRKTLVITAATAIEEVGTDNEGYAVALQPHAVVVTLKASVASASLRLYDTTGRLTSKAVAQDLRAGSALTLDRLAPGIYTLVATFDGQTSAVKVVVK